MVEDGAVHRGEDDNDSFPCPQCSLSLIGSFLLYVPLVCYRLFIRYLVTCVPLLLRPCSVRLYYYLVLVTMHDLLSSNAESDRITRGLNNDDYLMTGARGARLPEPRGQVLYNCSCQLLEPLNSSCHFSLRSHHFSLGTPLPPILSNSTMISSAPSARSPMRICTTS